MAEVSLLSCIHLKLWQLTSNFCKMAVVPKSQDSSSKSNDESNNSDPKRVEEHSLVSHSVYDNSDYGKHNWKVKKREDF